MTAGVAEGAVAAGSCEVDFARCPGPPSPGVCATGGLAAGAVDGPAGAAAFDGVVAALGCACGRPLAGAVAVGASLFGAWTAGRAPAPTGAGGAFWVPGTGSECPAGGAVCGATAVGVTLTGFTCIAAGFAVGLLTNAAWLGLSCWLGLAWIACAWSFTAPGTGVSPPGRPGPFAATAAAAPALPAGNAAGGWLITVLMTVVLWMFW